MNRSKSRKMLKLPQICCLSSRSINRTPFRGSISKMCGTVRGPDFFRSVHLCS